MYMVSRINKRKVFGIVNIRNNKYLSKSELIDIMTGEETSFNKFLEVMSIVSKICLKFKCINDGAIFSKDEARIRELMIFLKKAGILGDENV